MDRELRKSGDTTDFATDGRAPRRYDGDTPRTVRCVPVFVRSEKPNALVGDGVPELRSARRTSTAPSVACSSFCDRSLESSSSAAHTLFTVGTKRTQFGSRMLSTSNLSIALCGQRRGRAGSKPRAFGAGKLQPRALQ